MYTLQTIAEQLWQTWATFSSRHILRTGIVDQQLSLMDSWNVVGVEQLYKHWPLVCLLPTVGKCETRQRKHQCSFTYEEVA
jgi:hypothetical protein